MAYRYWIGGDGDYEDSSHWSDTSGGTGGFSIPTTNDNIFFDINSSAIDYTVSAIDIYQYCKDLTVTAPLTGKLSLFTNQVIAGNISIVDNQTILFYWILDSYENSNDRTIDIGNNTGTDAFSIEFRDTDNLGITYTLLSDIILLNSVNLINNCIIDFNNYTITCDQLYTNSSSTLNNASINYTSVLTIDSPVTNGLDITVRLSTTIPIYPQQLNFNYNNTVDNLNITNNPDATGGELLEILLNTDVTITNINDIGNLAHTFQVTDNSNIFSVENFNVKGSSSNLIDVIAVMGSIGGLQLCDWIKVDGGFVTPSNTWFAGINGIDNALGTSNWEFQEYNMDLGDNSIDVTPININSIFNHNIIADTSNFLITTINTIISRGIIVTLDTTNYIVSVGDIIFLRTWGIVADTARYIITGINVNIIAPLRTIWNDSNKPSSSWTNTDKPSTSWNESNKPNTTWASDNKPSNSWASDNKPSNTWTDITKGQ